ncbi:unnamed protein product [Mesocestoides corti]|uniref:DUF4203 domain-containing protein n=1 Tax=Mesocestoides corti TaxID=53468 RepID=A0A0R3UNY3_MESCO|nr:unnamed protein product [Mesocestoides corti]
MQGASRTCFLTVLLACGILVIPSTCLDTVRRERLILNSLNPSVVCLPEPHLFKQFISPFLNHVLKINSTSVNAFPVHVFTALSKVDLLSRSPWLHESPSQSRVTPISSSFQSLVPSYFVVRENTLLEFSGVSVYCVGLLASQSRDPFLLNSHQHRIDVAFEETINWTCVARLLLGLIVFFVSPILSRSLVFYYTSGVLMSIIGGLLIVLFIGIRILPKRISLLLQGMVLVSGGAFSLLVLCLSYIRSVLWGFVTNNVGLVICYVSGMALLSASLFYWLSLPERLMQNFPRTQTMLNAGIRALGVLLIASAPQVPSDLPTVTTAFGILADWTKTQFDLDITSLMTILPLVMRGTFTIAVLSLLRLFPNRRKPSRRANLRSRGSYYLPPVPCAASSPYSWDYSRPHRTSPGSCFRGTSLTTNYGGYGYFEVNEDNPYALGHTNEYWDGSGQVFSPVSIRRKSGLSTPIQNMKLSTSSKLMRSNARDGSLMAQDDILTDDEEDD